MSSKKKNKLLKYLSVATGNLNCSCSRRSNPSNVYQPLSKPDKPVLPPPRTKSPIKFSFDKISLVEKHNNEHDPESEYVTATLSLNNNEDNGSSSGCTEELENASVNKIRKSVAVVKESEDPYNDFRRSMLQMIIEKEIYSKDGLEELLAWFLHLNPPCHHEAIIGAFTEIWNGVIFAPWSSSEKRKLR
ncbi:hypothetical protein Droror1_Dr00003184 [Drosera rotundifolia]